MISSNDFRNGVTIEIDGMVWQVVEFQHVKPGKGSAFVRTKLKNLKTGSVVERTFNAGEKNAFCTSRQKADAVLICSRRFILFYGY